MKIRDLAKAKYQNDNDCFQVPIAFLCLNIKVPDEIRFYNLPLSPEAWNGQKLQPLQYIESQPEEKPFHWLWLYRDYAIKIEEAESVDIEDVRLHIKHLILKREKALNKMRKDVERFERFEKANPIYREQISEEVRMFVWRRDEGKCVKCQSNENLEFDHIIPASKGGSNTERNIQLLCSECNKKKSNSI